MASESTCNNIYKNLLRFHDGDVLASAYIREFFKTAKCDHMSNFAKHREEYARMLGEGDKGCLKRILAYDETLKDEKIAAQAVMHYAHEHKQHLVDAVPFMEYLMMPREKGMRAVHASFVFIRQGQQAEAVHTET